MSTDETMIEYKGYIGHFTFDEMKNIFYGRVSNTNDFVTFQGKSIKEMHQSFHDAVDEYIQWHKKYPENPETSTPTEE